MATITMLAAMMGCSPAPVPVAAPAKALPVGFDAVFDEWRRNGGPETEGTAIAAPRSWPAWGWQAYGCRPDVPSDCIAWGPAVEFRLQCERLLPVAKEQTISDTVLCKWGEIEPIDRRT